MEPFASDPSHPEFEGEISDLAATGAEPQTPPRRVSLNRRLSKRARAWRLTLSGGALLLGLLVILLSLDPGVLVRWWNRQSTPPSPVVLRPHQQGLDCLIDATWSPDGQQMALLGYQDFCAGVGTPKPGVIAIYDVATGKLLKQLQPDRFILHALQQTTPPPTTPTPASPGSSAGPTPSILYQQVLWSSDGSRLALTFWVSLTPSTPPLTGLAVLDPGQSTVQVWLITDPAHDLTAATLWDTVSGLQTSRFAVPQFFPSTLGASFALTYPVALSYHWETTGDLTPQTSLPLGGSPPAAAPGPIGDPNVTRAFTIWQTGWVELITQVDVGPSYIPGVLVWHTTIAAWSPDGRYLMTNLELGARLVGQGVPLASSQAIHDLGFEHLPLLPVRDAGLLRLLRALDPAQPHALAVSWRPDGRILATADLSELPDLRVTCYDAASGSTLGSLQPVSRQASALAGPTALLRWAPDGAHLFFFSGVTGAATIWGPAQLPSR